jgi:signal transduction histidine kinase
VFDRFVRFAPSRHYGGFGLGLWIARQIVTLHGGELRVRSAPGQGSTFEFEVPNRPPASVNAAASTASVAILQDGAV